MRAPVLVAASAAFGFSLAFSVAVDLRCARSPDAGSAACEVALVQEAHATTSVLITLDELVKGSEQIALVQPVERFSRWEELGGSRRIVTYTNLLVERTLTGVERESVWVRTLGGTVDKIGQHVAGEAQFTLGERAVVFIGDLRGTRVVAGLSQGHFPIDLASDDARLKSSPDPGNLLSRRGPMTSARAELVGQPLEAAISKIRERAAKK